MGTPLRSRCSFANDFILRATVTQPGVIFTPKSYFERLVLADLFHAAQPLEVELGSGDGSFIIQEAKANPETNFLAVERLLGRLRKIERKATRGGLNNIRAMRIEAGYFIEYLLPAGCARALHIYFPDPWPKRKHWKNRLINERFVILASLILEPNGIVYLRTDDKDYFAQMTAVFSSSTLFKEVATPERLSGVLTDFEREFHSRGIPTRRAAYQKVTSAFSTPRTALVS